MIVIEPDSLPNLATNLKNPHCANTATNAAYTKGIQYAVATLSTKVRFSKGVAKGSYSQSRLFLSLCPPHPTSIHPISPLQAPKANLYIDAAHGAWLGWDDNAQVGWTRGSRMAAK